MVVDPAGPSMVGKAVSAEDTLPVLDSSLGCQKARKNRSVLAMQKGQLSSSFSDRHVNTLLKSNSSATKVGPGAGSLVVSSVSTNTGLAVGGVFQLQV